MSARKFNCGNKEARLHANLIRINFIQLRIERLSDILRPIPRIEATSHTLPATFTPHNNNQRLVRMKATIDHLNMGWTRSNVCPSKTSVSLFLSDNQEAVKSSLVKPKTITEPLRSYVSTLKFEFTVWAFQYLRYGIVLPAYCIRPEYDSDGASVLIAALFGLHQFDSHPS